MGRKSGRILFLRWLQNLRNSNGFQAFLKAGFQWLPMLPMYHWILGFWQLPIMIAIGMQNIQKCWEMHHLLWNKAWFQYDLPKSLCSGVKYGLKMWSGDLSKLKMCSGDRRNVLRRFSPSLKLPQKSPDIRTTISQNMHQYKGGWEQGGVSALSFARSRFLAEGRRRIPGIVVV